MTLENSPSLKNIADGKHLSPDPKNKQRLVHIITGLIGLVILVLLGIKFTQSDLSAQLTRKGIVTGSAVNEAGEAIPVEVLVFDTDILVRSDENGHFWVENVPAGEQAIIVAYGSIATEIVLEITPGVENPLATVTVPTDLLSLIDE